MPRRRDRLALLALLSLVAVLTAGCGRSNRGVDGAPAPAVLGPRAAAPAASSGGPTLVTRNTARLGGADPIADAAAVAETVFPGVTPQAHPQAVVLADTGDWMSALAASALMSPPFGAPLLYSSGTSLPSVSSDALKALAPRGANAVGGAQVIRVGNVATPSGFRSTSVPGGDPFTRAAAIARMLAASHPQPVPGVLIVSAQAPAYAMPAAGYAAEAGVPILFSDQQSLPPATAAALGTLSHPRIYVLGPGQVVGQRVVAALRRYGTVKRIRGADPASTSVAFAGFNDAGFGWNVVQPGHGLVFLNSSRPLDAAAAAALSSSGDFGPQLVLGNATQLPPSVHNYLLNIQPGYEPNTPGHGPVDESYNHGWVIGDGSAVSSALQVQIDQLLEIVPISPSSAAAAGVTLTP